MSYIAVSWFAKAAVPAHRKAKDPAHVHLLQAARLRELGKRYFSMQWDFGCDIVSVNGLQASGIDLVTLSGSSFLC